jgi:hypothetical protein
VAELKTKLSGASVDDFLRSIQDKQVRADSYAIAEIMEKAAKAKARMWGNAIVGFGSRKYKYPDGREMDWMVIAFSPRKKNITLYIAPDFEGCEDLMKELGNFSRGKSCLYIKRLSDVNIATLKKIVKASVQYVLKESAKK